MKRLIIVSICMMLFPFICFAEDIYISETLQGANTGTDCSNSHSTSWLNTSGNWANPKESGKIGPGDTAHLCGTITTQLTTKASGNSGSLITILFESGAKYSNTTWTASTAAITINKNYITLDGGTNGIIEATDNGTTSAFGGTKTYNRNIDGVLINASNNVTVKNLTIRTIYDRLASSVDCIKVGYNIHSTGQSSNITITGNTISDGYYGIYIVLTNSENVTVNNNIITNTSTGINIAPGNTSSTGSNINIYENDVRGGTKYDGVFDANCQTNGCSSSCLTDTWHHQDGIHLFSQGDTGWVNNVNVYNNYLQDFGTHSTSHIYIEYHGMQNVKIYNNVLVNTGTNYASGGMIGIKSADGVKIYNNTLIGNYPNYNGNIGIFFNSSGSTYSQGSIVQNNIISGVKLFYGWNGTLGTDTIFTADYNDNYNGGSSPYNNLSRDWWLAQGYDANGATVNPQLDSNYKLTSSSPASIKRGGANLSSIFTIDKDNMPRLAVAGWSLGAYQVIAPNPPTSLQIQ